MTTTKWAPYINFNTIILVLKKHSNIQEDIAKLNDKLGSLLL